MTAIFAKFAALEQPMAAYLANATGGLAYFPHVHRWGDLVLEASVQHIRYQIMVLKLTPVLLILCL